MIAQLLTAGVDVARLNFSHGTHADHATVYERLRAAAHAQGQALTILQDLQGPKIRTGAIPGGAIEITAGEIVTLTIDEENTDPELIPVDFPQLAASARPGSRILLDDGNLELEVLAVSGQQVKTRVVLGGLLKSHKGVNLPGVDLDIPGYTEKDAEDLQFGLELGVDAVAVSFVRRPADIEAVRTAIRAFAPGRVTPIIAKLERPEALRNLDAVVAAADGVMVARGDLGVEMSPEYVPIAQKQIIETANRQARFVITATQMLDSMINFPRPTRAEASDVANAVFDGTDAVMLSGETAAGKYPLAAVEMMDKIVRQAEMHTGDWGHCEVPSISDVTHDDTYFMARAAWELAQDGNVAAIAVFTNSGRTARLMSKLRPSVPILGFTPHMDIHAQMNLLWGVTPHLVPHADTIEAMLEAVEATMIASTAVEAGQQFVLIAGFPVKGARPTNLALLHTVGSAVR
jgi:pyruvate kinase